MGQGDAVGHRQGLRGRFLRGRGEGQREPSGSAAAGGAAKYWNSLNPRDRRAAGRHPETVSSSPIQLSPQDPGASKNWETVIFDRGAMKALAMRG